MVIAVAGSEDVPSGLCTPGESPRAMHVSDWILCCVCVLIGRVLNHTSIRTYPLGKVQPSSDLDVGLCGLDHQSDLVSVCCLSVLVLVSVSCVRSIGVRYRIYILL